MSIYFHSKDFAVKLDFLTTFKILFFTLVAQIFKNNFRLQKLVFLNTVLNYRVPCKWYEGSIIFFIVSSTSFTFVISKASIQS